MAGHWKVGEDIYCELQLPGVFAGTTIRVRCRAKVARIVKQSDGMIGIGAAIEAVRFVRPQGKAKPQGDAKPFRRTA